MDTEVLVDAIQEHTSLVTKFAEKYMTVEFISHVIAVSVIIFVLFILHVILIKVIRRAGKTHACKDQTARILKKLVRYAFYTLAAMNILELFGIKLSAVWGAAGVAGVAIGFAAQTSVSNLISGLFVVSEHALKIGDLITVGDITGTVDMISLLSVRIHTPDNQMVRIPNSSIINTNLTNITYFPMRRMTIAVSISYDTDMQQALEVLKTAPALCPTVLKDPEPKAWFDGFDDSGIKMVLAVWFNRDDFIQTKNDAYIAIKKVYDDAGISIPFNQLDVRIMETGAPVSPDDKA